ncbi:hypothetical protein Tco_1343170 [Tanacetum coccineum]
MSGTQDEIPPPPPPQETQQTPSQQTPQTVSTIKADYCSKRENRYMGLMKIKHLVWHHTDYPIWEVIQNGNGPVSVTTDTSGQINLPLKTAEEVVARERERKARTTLLMAIPEDHLAKFHKMIDAKEMWNAIKSRFGGNDESKKMQKYILKQQFEGFTVSNIDGIHKGYERFQSLLSQLEIHGAGVSTEDANQKFLRSLPSAWLQSPVENEVKCSTHHLTTCKNVSHFVSDNTKRTNEVSTAYGEGGMNPGNKWEAELKVKEESKEQCSGSNTQVTSCSIECKESYANLKRLYDAQREELSDASGNPDPSPRPSPTPSPTPIVPDSIPEPTGENLGDHSSNDTSLSGNEDDIELPNAKITKLKKQAKPVIKHHKEYLKTISLQQRFPKKSFSKKQRVHTKSVSKQGRKKAKGKSEVQRDPLFEVLPKDKIDHMETENAQTEGRTSEMVDEEKEFDEDRLSTEDEVSTVKEGVSTDFEKVSTDRPKVSEEQKRRVRKIKLVLKNKWKVLKIKLRKILLLNPLNIHSNTYFNDKLVYDETIATLLLNMSKAKAASKEKEKGVELKDVEEIDRPRPTSTRSLLTLKPLPKIDPKDKGKKKIEEEEESESER